MPGPPGSLRLSAERARVLCGVGPGLLLLLLLHALDYFPDQVPGLALHLDGVGLVRVVELEQVLNAPDLAQGARQHLRRALLLLLPLGLLLLALLLITLRHLVLLTTRRLLYPEGLYPLPATLRLYPVCVEVRHVVYPRGSGSSLLTAQEGHDKRVARRFVETRD